MSFRDDMRAALGDARFESYFCECSMRIEGRRAFVSSAVAVDVLERERDILAEHGVKVVFDPSYAWPPCRFNVITDADRERGASLLRDLASRMGRA